MVDPSEVPECPRVRPNGAWQARTTAVFAPPVDLNPGLLGMEFDYRLRALFGTVDPEATF
jgi:hypothetical protein